MALRKPGNQRVVQVFPRLSGFWAQQGVVQRSPRPRPSTVGSTSWAVGVESQIHQSQIHLLLNMSGKSVVSCAPFFGNCHETYLQLQRTAYVVRFVSSFLSKKTYPLCEHRKVMNRKSTLRSNVQTCLSLGIWLWPISILFAENHMNQMCTCDTNFVFLPSQSHSCILKAYHGKPLSQPHNLWFLYKVGPPTTYTLVYN